MLVVYTVEKPIYGRHIRAPAPLDALVHLAKPVMQTAFVVGGVGQPQPVFTGDYHTCLGVLTAEGLWTKTPTDWEVWIVDEPVTCLVCLATDVGAPR